MTELRDLHSEAARAEADMSRADRLDEAEQRVRSGGARGTAGTSPQRGLAIASRPLLSGVDRFQQCAGLFCIFLSENRAAW